MAIASNYDSNDDSDYHPFGNDVECKSDSEDDQSRGNTNVDNDNTEKNKDKSVCDDEITSCDNDCNCCSSDQNDSDEPPRKRRRINSSKAQQQQPSDKQKQNNNHSSHNGAPDKSPDIDGQNSSRSSHQVEKCFNEEYCQYLEKAGLFASPKRICYGKYVSHSCVEIFALYECLLNQNFVVCFDSMHQILNHTLERAIIQKGVKKDSKKKLSKPTLVKRETAARLIALNPLEFEAIADTFKNNFLCDEMIIEIRAKLVSYYNSMRLAENPEVYTHYTIDDLIAIPSLKRWIEDSRNGSFWPTQNSWINAAKTAWYKLGNTSLSSRYQ